MGFSSNHSEHMLFDQGQQPYPRGDDRERITQARREAEALFTAKQSVSTPSVPDQPTPAGQSPRKPRILRALSPAPVRQREREAPVSSKPRMPPEIPSSHFARIRTWVKYGMTAAQVAGVYGVGIETIEHILRHA
jgi:hypothetical protein